MHYWYGSREGNWISGVLLNSSEHDQLIQLQEYDWQNALEKINKKRVTWPVWKRMRHHSLSLVAQQEWSMFCMAQIGTQHSGAWTQMSIVCSLVLSRSLSLCILPAMQIVSPHDGRQSKKVVFDISTDPHNRCHHHQPASLSKPCGSFTLLCCPHPHLLTSCLFCCVGNLADD